MEYVNRLEKAGPHIIKHYGSHMAYAREKSILEKLKGTGLAPEIYGSMDGTAEYGIVEGPNAEDAIRASLSSPDKLRLYFSEICRWYKKYREKVHLLIGNIDFSKFILTEKGPCYTDFEHARPGRIEEDISDIMAVLCFFEGDFTEKGVEAAKLFAEISREILGWDPDIAGDYLPQSIGDMSDSCGASVDGSDLMELMWALTPERKDND